MSVHVYATVSGRFFADFDEIWMDTDVIVSSVKCKGKPNLSLKDVIDEDLRNDLAFPIDFAGRPYITLTLLCEHVI